MKKFVLSIIIAAGGFMAHTAQAQVGVNVGFRVGPMVINLHKPVAPPVVYDNFYYLPDVDAYYSVPEQCYYYMEDNRWAHAAYLPGRYHDYDWRSVRRYQVRAERPYANHDYYRNRFGGSRGCNWNSSNDVYASRVPSRLNDRENYKRFSGSPYDSNNAGGGYYQPDRRDRDDRYERNDRNRQRDNSRGGWDGRPYNQDRNPDNDGGRNNWNKQRDNSGVNYGRPSNDNNGGNYGRPSNDNNGRGNGGQPGQNDNRGGNRGNNGNQYGGSEQRFTQNNNRDSKPSMGSVERVSF